MPTTLLLADESATIRKIVELTFSDSDVRVVTAASGAEALETWRRLAPDVLLVDVGLTDPDGYELCRRVKDSDRSLPVGLLVNTFERVDDERFAACGADGKLSKPFESSALVEWVHDLVEPAADAQEPDEAEEPPAVAEAPIETPEASLDPDSLSDELVDAVARRVVERLSVEAIREIAREVIPEVAAEIVRERIRELEDEES